MLPDKETIAQAAALIAETVPPTPQYAWPLLSERVGATVWMKHENHTPTGAFKIRGGLVLMDALRRDHPTGDGARRAGVVAATRGNHGQSIALAARLNGFSATIVVPHGNSVEKNAAMRGFGAELIVHGADFDQALDHARSLADTRGLLAIPSFDPRLVAGVATYGVEFLSACSELDTVYVPIGLGSGICGVVAAREALGLTTTIVGVVSTGAPAYKHSFDQRRIVATETADTRLADGMAVRQPDPAALEVIWRHVDRVVAVDDAEIAEAMRLIFAATHNIAEGAGAAALAAVMQERSRMTGRKVGVVLCGANVDTPVFASVLSETGAAGDRAA